ncbi:hypothetical protein [Micromonospora sp. MH99]|uniref:hypothetical protein n=1 Tax=Micromonospora sp. MH99 TaxID=1945510 RepID=UPI001F3A07E3|nr:hypothetical protein [Micromonospora sp. MH99]MCF0091273.1 hypothetical protein [Micromonospora sp. MH99]
MRLAKYVPAETLAFFVPVTAGIDAGRNGLFVLVVVIGLVGTIGYLWLAAQKLDSDERPLPHFYILAGVAYLCWAAGTSTDVAKLVSMDRIAAGVVLGGAVFLIPMLDAAFTRLLQSR